MLLKFQRKNIFLFGVLSNKLQLDATIHVVLRKKPKFYEGR